MSVIGSFGSKLATLFIDFSDNSWSDDLFIILTRVKEDNF
jgi:hypothetical protein